MANMGYWLFNPLEKDTLMALWNINRGYRCRDVLTNAYLLAEGLIEPPKDFAVPKLTDKGRDALEYYAFDLPQGSTR